MNKRDEYSKAIEEFNAWLYKQFLGLRSTPTATETYHYDPPKDRVAKQNLRDQIIAQIYQDLKMIHQEFAHFRKSEINIK